MNQTVKPALAPSMAAPSTAANQAAYLSGFGNGFETEALPGALPIGRNSPQRCAYGLYAEQLSGSPFTAPRATNERSWLYRIRPTVTHWGRFRKIDAGLWRTAPCTEVEMAPAPLRWDPVPLPEGQGTGFLEGIRTITTAGDAATQAGMGTHLYLVTRSMRDEYFYNADGEMLFVPQQGDLRLWTEFGIIDIEPGEIAVIPRGVKLRVELHDEQPARGYLCENYGGAFTLPDRGPIGANCLANPRDFLTPVAAYEDRDAPSTLTIKWGGSLWRAEIAHSPLDVVAWHGNYAPYKYDLRRYSPVGPILFDHADPSIFTVLTSPSETPGTANIDFVIFPDRWLVAENTFRPPWYHMNVMSEFMGLIYGVYDAKTGGGFAPGGFSLHNTMLPHGPDQPSFEKASSAELKPHKLEGTLAFMFETRFPQRVTRFAAEAPQLQSDYAGYGLGLRKNFDPSRP
ncbi:Homogentisate 1,2-dioxygenase [Roseomonas mucosa]|uniref:Homogentisate 1,2-dioxygenase n=1 Tax=Roseomonas mucosa TaxID=207340 RepID=A0A1S8D2Q1_9PROT|nr:MULTISPECIES: homogentisate 1,2-dioxygenase [Roseomonas]ATR21322.1 homogentisate 1,2-dioxygenase [Roseomonas sp. FDAARGOS_362]ONH82583.1 homogentisate 1,2-dioxygenase [Roseomonas mucosa]USQ70628.1 homogentisate 1,2-dioxygenase [Roseomonas mucosa]UZO96330.1 Homogentisate 1,2-dioxygenase [Roseomonas mucosa]GAV35886.1 homogentisate 1,2-dioxygenase [Roseomonas sp. TAS13]